MRGLAAAVGHIRKVYTNERFHLAAEILALADTEAPHASGKNEKV